jgi:dephospho-CoA kinase
MTTLPAQGDMLRNLPRDVAGCFVPGEHVVFAVKPGPASIVLRRLGSFIAIVTITALAVWLALLGWMPLTGFAALMLGLAAFAVLAFWGHLDWAMRDYVLTDRRVISSSGVIRRLTVESPIQALQQVVIYRSLKERLFGLGTVGVSTPADAGAPSVVWSMVATPDMLVAQVRFEMARTAALRQDDGQAARAQQSAMNGATRGSGGTIPVIGLAGGIGAGKSTVAGILARLGCLVVDSDARAKAALDRPDVRDQLVQWWGEEILHPGVGGDRRVDRSKVAQVIFADPEQRKRLEALVHPIVRQDRAAAAREGAAAGAKAVVVDAPLLFEAGLDAECDAVIFVDAPRQTRLERVREHRGWSAEELARREAAQLPLQTKRSKADYVVVNDGPIPDLQARVAGVLESMMTRPGASPV